MVKEHERCQRPCKDLIETVEKAVRNGNNWLQAGNALCEKCEKNKPEERK